MDLDWLAGGEGVTDTRAAADERRAIIREIDRMRDNLANRACPGFALLDRLKLWLLARNEKEGAE